MDRTDIKILSTLQKDGRLSNQGLADQVGKVSLQFLLSSSLQAISY